MKYVTHGFRYGDYLIRNVEEYRPYWAEIANAIESVSEDEIIAHFKANGEGKWKSISPTINTLLKSELVARGWRAESPIFSDPAYLKDAKQYRLDFAKGVVSLEVAFNHGNDAPWNLLKPTLASELNHVQKAIQTEIGVIITATKDMKEVGGFDGAVGDFDKYVEFLKPLGMLLTSPLVIVGLKAPEAFHVEHVKSGNKQLGYIVLD